MAAPLRSGSQRPSADDLARYFAAEADMARLFRLAWIVTVVLVAGVGGWAATSSISGAVIAAGTVAVEGKRKVLQHLDGGVVAHLHVRDGDVVESGNLLVTLDAEELRREVAGLDKEISARSQQIELIEGELKNLLELLEKRLVAHNRVTTLQREASSLAGDIARLSGQKAKVEARLARVEIRAPIAGRVHNLVTHTVGGVIPPNATIGEIVPSHEGLLIEARVAPEDVDEVRTGQQAHVRMTSLKQRTTPSLPGRVEQISADLMRDDPKGRDYYLARILLAEAAPQLLAGKPLVPGMPADVLIETQRRSVLSYLTKPLMDQIAHAFREE
jgi:multidrug efflux pump subunit AcrA (membrane-fusion protein)